MLPLNELLEHRFQDLSPAIQIRSNYGKEEATRPNTGERFTN